MDEFRDIKVEPSEFNGNLNADEYLEWVQAMDRISKAKGYDDDKGFNIASLKLTRYTSLWFENVKKEHARDGKRKINSWEKLKSLMNKGFYPKSYKQDIYNRFFSLKQNNMSVCEYLVTKKLCVPMRHNALRNTMKLDNFFEVKVGYVRCIIGLLTSNEVSHL